MGVSSKGSMDYKNLAFEFEVGLASKGSFDCRNMAFEEVFYGGKKRHFACGSHRSGRIYEEVSRSLQEASRFIA